MKIILIYLLVLVSLFLFSLFICFILYLTKERVKLINISQFLDLFRFCCCFGLVWFGVSQVMREKGTCQEKTNHPNIQSCFHMSPLSLRSTAGCLSFCHHLRGNPKGEVNLDLSYAKQDFLNHYSDLLFFPFY